MTTLLLAGAGEVGVRAARQLLDTPGVDRVVVAARPSSRLEEVAGALGVETIELGGLPEHVDAVALAVPGPVALPLAAQAVSVGVSVAAACDDREGITGLLALDAEARQRHARVVAGCAMAPGLTDVLARHAADALDEADEIHVARVGAAGDACLAALRRSRRDRPVEWSEGAAREEARLGPELVWFPDPVGARECVTVAAPVETLHEAVPTVRRALVRAADVAPKRRRVFGGRQPRDGEWGAARVEVFGSRDGVRQGVVYGVLEHPAVAAGTVLAVAAARIAGLLSDLRLRMEEPGACSLGALMEPPPFLAELARRGVKAAAFEGVTAS